MPRKSTVPAAPTATARVGEDHAALALREATVLMAPIARWLLRSGVPYPAFADVLKSVFVDVARAELEGAGVEFLGETIDSGVCFQAPFKDPDGNVLILHPRYAPR